MHSYAEKVKQSQGKEITKDATGKASKPKASNEPPQQARDERKEFEQDWHRYGQPFRSVSVIVVIVIVIIHSFNSNLIFGR